MKRNGNKTLKEQASEQKEIDALYATKVIVQFQIKGIEGWLAIEPVDDPGSGDKVSTWIRRLGAKLGEMLEREQIGYYVLNSWEHRRDGLIIFELRLSDEGAAFDRLVSELQRFGYADIYRVAACTWRGQRYSNLKYSKVYPAVEFGLDCWFATPSTLTLNPSFVEVLVKQFIAQRCRVREGKQVQTRYLYRVYQAWVAKQGHLPMTETAFSLAISSLGFTKKKTASYNVWINLEVLAANTQQE